MMKNNEKGNAVLILILLVLVSAAAVLYLYSQSYSSSDTVAVPTIQSNDLQCDDLDPNCGHKLSKVKFTNILLQKDMIELAWNEELDSETASRIEFCLLSYDEDGEFINVSNRTQGVCSIVSNGAFEGLHIGGAEIEGGTFKTTEINDYGLLFDSVPKYMKVEAVVFSDDEEPSKNNIEYFTQSRGFLYQE